MKHVIRTLAKDDIIRQCRYYLLADALDVAFKFLNAINESIERLLPYAALHGYLIPATIRSASAKNALSLASLSTGSPPALVVRNEAANTI